MCGGVALRRAQKHISFGPVTEKNVDQVRKLHVLVTRLHALVTKLQVDNRRLRVDRDKARQKTAAARAETARITSAAMAAATSRDEEARPRALIERP